MNTTTAGQLTPGHTFQFVTGNAQQYKVRRIAHEHHRDGTAVVQITVPNGEDSEFPYDVLTVERDRTVLLITDTTTD